MAEGRVAVVGAGLAGLSAALDLKRRGYTVELFERSRLIGGKATSFEVDGIEVDNGQHVFLACCNEFISFLRTIGLTVGKDDKGREPLYLQERFEAMIVPRSGESVILRAADLPAPFHFLPALIASRHLGWMGRIQIAWGLMGMRRRPLPAETFSRWLRRHHQGRRAIAGFWDPFVVPALNAGFDAVSADDARYVMQTAFLDGRDNARFGFSRVPLGRLGAKAAAELDEVHLRSAVTSVELDDSPSASRHVTLGFSEKQENFDAVVLALPPDRLKSALGRPKSIGVFGLDQFTHAPIVDVHLWFDAPAGTAFGTLDFAALLESPIQWVFEKAAPPGETYLCCSMSAAESHVGERREDLVEMATRELRARIPALREARLIRSAATRDREATFVPSVGLMRPSNRTRHPRIAIAGAWTDTGWPATMESAVRSGKMAAELIHGAIAA